MRQRFGLLMAVVMVVLALPAAADNVFVIRDVPVDETAGSADEARRVAIARGEAEAWNRLMLRLVVPGQVQRVPQMSGSDLESMIQSFEIADERLTSDRYRALVTVRFRADAVRGLLDANGIDHANEPSPLLLVLPVVDTDNGAVLWSEDNAWLSAWQHEPGGGKVIDVVVPIADLEDIMAIDAGAAIAGDWQAMQQLMARYQADGVLVVDASEGADGMALSADWYDSAIPREVAIDPLAPDGRTSQERFQEAVAQVRNAVDAQWTAASSVPEGPEETLVADIAVRSLSEWVDMRTRLERPASILQAQPLVIGTGKVRVLVRYVGGIEQLQAGLRQSGLTLTPQGDAWLILPL